MLHERKSLRQEQHQGKTHENRTGQGQERGQGQRQVHRRINRDKYGYKDS